MSTCYGDPVFDFDLNFLRSTPSTTLETFTSEKQRQNILFIKKKILSTDSLITKYYRKNEALEQSEKNLLSAKEECKQICIDYKQSVDTCSTLEKSLQELRDANKELESKYSNLESQFQALGSHTSQLQTLVKEYETRIEALKIENKLGKTSDKDYKKVIQPLQKENSLLIKHLCLARDIIFGKRKYRLLHKTIFKKYDKYKSPDKDPLFEEDENTMDYVSDDIPLTPFSEYDDDAEPSKDNKLQNVKNPNNADLSRITNNSTVESHDVASIDTGRGSSLALSVSEKSFQSPEYFISDSPLNDDNELNKVKAKLVNSSTSPIPFYALVNVSTSPIIFEHNVQKTHAAVDRALSPIFLTAGEDDDACHVNDDVSVSSESNNAQENCKNNKDTIESEKQQKEIECLELNNSENICKESSNDCEIEMIFNTMRLHNTLITPIPSTPAKSCSTSSYSTPNKQNQPGSIFCSEAVLAREENKKLQVSVAELAKELANIKNMLINKSILMQNNEECPSYNELCGEFSTNKDEIMTAIPSQATHENNTALGTIEKTRSSSRRNSLNVSMDFANLQVISEVEENLEDTSELQYEEDLSPSINDTEKIVGNVCKPNTQSLETTVISIDGQSHTNGDQNERRLMKRKKITKLEKLKRKCLPKYKIRREHVILKEKSVKPKRISISEKKKTVTETDTSATLNDKNVYEKAVKVMSELKSKKSISPESIVVQQIEQNVSEQNTSNDIIDTEFCEDKKRKDNNNSVSPTTVMDYQSDPIQTPLASPESRSNDVSGFTLDKDEHDNEEHVVVFKVLSTLPDDYNNLKRKPDSISPEIPCKRMLSNTILDMVKLKDAKVILERCETSTILNNKSASDNISGTTKNITTTNCKKSPSKIKNAATLFSPEETEIIKRRRRKSVKDKIPQQSRIEANESQGQNDGQTIYSTRRKRVRDLFYTDVIPNVQESHGNEDFISNEENTLKDIFSPDFFPESPNSFQIVDTQNILQDKSSQEDFSKTKKEPAKNVRQSLSNNRRKSVRDCLSADSTMLLDNQESRCNQNVTSNERQNVKDKFVSEVNLKGSKLQEKDYNGKFSFSPRKTFTDISSPDVSSEVLQSMQSNSDEVTQTGRTSEKDRYSPKADPETSDSQKVNSIKSIQNLSNRRKDITSSLQVGPKILENQTKNTSKDLLTNRRNSVKDVSTDSSANTSDSQDIITIQETFSNGGKHLEHIYSPEVSRKTLESRKIINCQDFQEGRTNRRKSVASIYALETNPKGFENQNRNENHSVHDFVSNRRKSVRGISSTEFRPKAPDNLVANDKQSIQNVTGSRRKSVRDPTLLEASSNALEDQNTNKIHAMQDNTSNRRKSPRDISSLESISTASEGQKRNGNQCIEDITSHRRKSVKCVSSPEFSPKPPENQKNCIQNVTNYRKKNVKEIFCPEIGPKNPETQEQFDHSNDASNLRRDLKDSDCGNNVMALEQNVSNKRRKFESCSPENLDITENVTDVRENILCRMIEQYGVKSVKFAVKKIPDSIINSTAKKIEDGIIRITEVPSTEAKDSMNKFVMDIQNWEVSHFVAGLIKYLKDPTRKIELFSKVVVPSAPALTKSEQILLYVISELKKCWSSVDIIDKILSYIEYTLFSLNRTPQFEVIESMSHFYAVVCRYFKMKTRLRLFVLDAMYCIQFKAIPLIKQCIEVWMHILPLAHMASAQTPLVTCLVYLLHFYKCDDKLNRVQEIRNILSRKYFYKITEWNETRILELCRNSIIALKGISSETKMLRLSLIILAKRQGPRWCHNNLVKNVLKPIIEKQNSPEHIKAFCVSMFGPLLKPFPADMKVHCEVVMNQLITMLQDSPSPIMAEAAVTSLLFINKHNQFKVIQALVAWRQKDVSPELEQMLKDFVKSKPLKIWKTTLAKAVQ